MNVTQRSYKADIALRIRISLTPTSLSRSRLYALTYDYDGYSKFEVGGQVSSVVKFTKTIFARAGLLGARHVEVTSADIDPVFLGDTSYFVSSVGFTQTLDLREESARRAARLRLRQHG